MDEKQVLFKRALFKRLKYKPHFGQEKIHFPTDPWIFFVAVWGRRSGKTHAAAMEAIYYLAQPDTRIWVVAPSYPLAEKVFREVWQAVVLDGVLGNPEEVVVAKRMDPRSGNMLIRTKWGSWIEGKSSDNPISLVGEGLDFLIIDEAAKVKSEVYSKYLEPTLLDRKGRCLMITTPEGHNWLFEYYIRGFNKEDKANGWACSKFLSEDNPYLDKDWIANKKRELGNNTVFKQEYEASFEHHTGLVWPEFRDYLFPKGHQYNESILERIPEWWTHYRSIDIGLDNPTACIWAAINPKGDIYIYDEYRVRDTLADTHAENIRAKTNAPIFTTYISHDADNRAKTDGQTVRGIYSSKGVHTYPVRPDRAGSIQQVARHLRATLEDSPVFPRLFIHESCTMLRTEMQQYVWEHSKSGMDREAPDKPHRYKNDLVDALRNLLQMRPKFIPTSIGEMQPEQEPPVRVDSNRPFVRI